MKIKLKVGSKVKVKSLNHKHKASKRLIDMGITPDTIITVKRIAPLGDPFIIEVRDYLLAVRKKDLKAAEFEQIKDS